mgnify:CR=1 FL=1
MGVKIGCHIPAAGGYTAMVERALSIGADTFQYFTRNPRGGAVRAYDEADMRQALQKMRAGNIEVVVAHAPYTLNPCAIHARAQEFAQYAFRDDLQKLQAFPQAMYNLHPGCHVGQGIEAGLDRLVEFLRENVPEGCETTILLETMAGKGSEVGGRFEELRAIIDRVELTEHIGVCLDTCHIWDAGYDIAGDLDGVLSEFDRVIGLERLHAVHLNNSLNPCGSHKDRHAKLLDGCIPPEALVRVTRHPALAELPFILETPNDDAGYAQEIAWLRAAQN